jgi:hypothetical protein
MNSVSKESKKTNGANGAHEPASSSAELQKRETEDAVRARCCRAEDLEKSALAEIAEARRQLDFLARNMVEAFGERLDGEESNAYCALVTARGHLLNLEECIYAFTRAVAS